MYEVVVVVVVVVLNVLHFVPACASTPACRNQDFQQDGISATFSPVFFFAFHQTVCRPTYSREDKLRFFQMDFSLCDRSVSHPGVWAELTLDCVPLWRPLQLHLKRGWLSERGAASFSFIEFIVHAYKSRNPTTNWKEKVEKASTLSEVKSLQEFTILWQIYKNCSVCPLFQIGLC